jgi:hypothetical protein
VEALCCLISDRRLDLAGEFRWQFVHAVSRASVLGACLQEFLLGFALGYEIAVYANVPTIDRLCHLLTS